MASQTQSLITMDGLSSIGYVPYSPAPLDINYSPVNTDSFNVSKPWIVGNTDAVSAAPVVATDTPTPTNQVVSPVAQIKGSNFTDADAKAYYDRAYKQQIAGAVAGLGSAAYNVFAAQQGRKVVAFENAQLDVQKQMIDTNVAATSAALMDQMTDATSQLQALSAAKNVDIQSQGVQSQIVAGGQDLGEDVRDIQMNSKLQKAAVDYQKAANKVQQAQAEQNAIAGFAVQAASSVISFL